MEITNPDDNYLYFSIVIPAHNEENYIDKTIQSIKKLDYPRKKIEVIIIENGSKDKTMEITRQLSPEWFKVLSISEANVSKAKNIGIDHIDPNADWVIFLDADTYFEKGFLIELNRFLFENRNNHLGCGMVSLLPSPDSLSARCWYRFYNFANFIVRTTRSIQIIRSDLLLIQGLRFDEFLSFDEDTYLLRQCIARSRYFFMKTNKVFSSTRRFVKNGWVRQLIEWIYFASSSYEKKRQIRYKVLR
jgi:glycosyltransferase involved in cell wall biosynthesis